MTYGEKQGTHQENRLTDIQMEYNFRVYFNYFGSPRIELYYNMKTGGFVYFILRGFRWDMRAIGPE
jgi:hypothetical protein